MTEITIDLPFPMSVNSTRKVDWRASEGRRKWLTHADALVMASRRPKHKILGKYEATIVLSEAHGKADLDNGIKSVIDYAHRIELVTDDSQKYLRRLVVEWGDAPEGCRLILRPLEQST